MDESESVGQRAWFAMGDLNGDDRPDRVVTDLVGFGDESDALGVGVL